MAFDQPKVDNLSTDVKKSLGSPIFNWKSTEEKKKKLFKLKEGTWGRVDLYNIQLIFDFPQVK